MPLYTTGAQALKASGWPALIVLKAVSERWWKTGVEMGELRSLSIGRDVGCGFGKASDGVVRKRRRKEI
jgi:hypothetical protein